MAAKDSNRNGTPRTRARRRAWLALPFPRRSRNERGSVLILVALSMVALIGMLALSIDLAMLFVAHGEAQRAADAAALAGASAFIDDDPSINPEPAQAEAENRVYEYALMNEIRNVAIDASEVEPEYFLDQARVRVTIRRQNIPLFFASIFGINSWRVSAQAMAEAAQAGSASCVMPFAIPDMWIDNNNDTNGNGIWDFDINIPCNGNRCNQNEVWSFDPGDVYISAADDPFNATGYGSAARDGNVDHHGRTYELDHGRRIPLKLQGAQSSGTPSFWFPWVIPGSPNKGASAFVDNIKGCVDQADIGNMVDIDVETKNGLMPKPTYDAIKERINEDPDPYWDEEAGEVVYPDGSDSPYKGNWTASPRVVTVAIFHPEDMRQGKNYMRFVDFGRFFLEDPDVVYPGANPPHSVPITGRLIRFASGDAGPEQGTLIRFLRLVQ